MLAFHICCDSWPVKSQTSVTKWRHSLLSNQDSSSRPGNKKLWKEKKQFYIHVVSFFNTSDCISFTCKWAQHSLPPCQAGQNHTCGLQSILIKISNNRKDEDLHVWNYMHGWVDKKARKLRFVTVFGIFIESLLLCFEVLPGQVEGAWNLL